MNSSTDSDARFEALDEDHAVPGEIDRVRLLGELARLLHSGQAPAESLEAVSELAAAALGAPFVGLLLVNERGELVHRSGGVIPEGVLREVPTATLQRWMAALAEQGARSWFARDLVRSGFKALLSEAHLEHLAATVVSAGDSTFGLLSAARTGVPFGDAELVTLDLVATLLGESLASSRRLREEEVGRRSQEALTELALLANSVEHTDSAWRSVYPLLLRALDCPYAGMLAADGSGRFRGMSSFDDGSVQFGAFEAAEIGLDDFKGDAPTVYDPGEMRIRSARARARMGLVECATVPLRVDGEVLGMLTAGSRERNAFDARRLKVLAFAANILARGLAGERQFAVAGRNVRRHEALSRAALLLSSDAPCSAIWPEIEAIGAEAINCIHLSVIVPEADGSLLALGPAGGVSDVRVVTPEQAALRYFKPGRGMTFTVSGHPAWAARALAAEGVAEAYSVPLADGDTVIGVLTAGYPEHGMIAPEERHFVEVLGALIARVSVARRALDRARREAEEQRIIGAVAAAAASEQDPARAVAVLNTQLAARIPGVVTSFGFLDGEFIEFQGSDIATHVRVRVNPFFRGALDEGQLAGPAFPANEIVSLSPLGETLIHACSLTTSSASGEVIGALFVGSRDAEFAWHDKDLELLRVLARILGPVMANSRATARALREANEQRMIAGVTSAAATEREPSRLARRLAAAIGNIIPGPIVTWAHIEGDEIAWLTLSNVVYREPISRGVRRVIERGQYSTAEVSHDIFPEFSEFRTLGAHAYSLTVARTGGDASGLLAVASNRVGWTWSERDLELLGTVAGILGPAMARARDADRIAAERVLYDTIVRSLSEAVLVFDHDLRPVFWNSHGQRIARTLEPFGEDLIAVLPHLNRDAADAIAAALEGNEPARGRARLDVDGQESWFDFEAIPLHHPDYAFLLVAADATAKVQRERVELSHRAELAAAAARAERDRALYNLTLESLSEAVFLVGQDPADARQLEVAFVNNAGHQLGALLAERGGHPLVSVEDYRRALPAPVAEAFLRGIEGHTGARCRTSLGENSLTRWIDWEIVPLPAPLTIMVVGSDVTAEVEREGTEERHRQQLEQASRLAALGELIGGVAHELNNPLTAVLGFAELLAISPQAGPFREELHVIRKEAERARDVVRDLLFMARPGAAERTAVDLAEVVGHIERLKRAAWSREGINVVIDLGAVTAPVMANEHQLVQILLNLVTNAEHALRGQPDPAIRISGATGPDAAQLTVADNGPGMSAEVAGRVFEPFFTTRPGVGNGLGLGLSYTIAVAHGGKLELDTAPGKGARFSLTLPLTERAARPADPGPVGPPRHISFLVVDDEPNVRRVCERLITSMGHRCVTAPDSVSAAAAAEAQDFDVVLCDYRLCAETAADVVKALALIRPRLLTRLIIATGAISEPGVDALMREYGLRVLAKPYGLRDIAAIAAEVGEAAAQHLDAA